VDELGASRGAWASIRTTADIILASAGPAERGAGGCIARFCAGISAARVVSGTHPDASADETPAPNTSIPLVTIAPTEAAARVP
jgi:hypothetical protein